MKDELKAAAAKEVELLDGHIGNITNIKPNQNAEALAEWRQAMGIKGVSQKEKQEFIEVVDTMLTAKGNPQDPHLFCVDLKRNEFILKYDALGPGRSIYAGYNVNGEKVFFAQEGNGAFAITNPTENPRYLIKDEQGRILMHFVQGKTISQILDNR
jgi:hypothetical protein